MAKKVGKEKTTRGAAPARSSKVRSSSAQSKDPSTARFVNDLLVRGEAAELDDQGKLPLQATHIIQKNNPDGTVQVKRARYKVF
jgi:hypothetical protein